MKSLADEAEHLAVLGSEQVFAEVASRRHDGRLHDEGSVVGRQVKAGTCESFQYRGQERGDSSDDDALDEV